MFSYRQLQRLEERLSIQIFERTSKIVRLTDDGKAFCDEALALLAHLEEVAFSCATPRDILQVHPALREGDLRRNGGCLSPNRVDSFLGSRRQPCRPNASRQPVRCGKRRAGRSPQTT